MCRVCDEPCWRDGGEAECSFADEEFDAVLATLERSSGVIDLMERLKESLQRAKRHKRSGSVDGSE